MIIGGVSIISKKSPWERARNPNLDGRCLLSTNKWEVIARKKLNVAGSYERLLGIPFAGDKVKQGK